MEIKQLVESIVREIVTAIEPEIAKPPKVLYVFGDSTAHEAYTDHFILLQNHGIAHDLMFLDGETSAWLGKHRIESGGPGKVIAVDEFAPAPLEVPLEYDGVVIPEIDIDNMGRASLGIRGTVLSEVIFASLVTGKFVLIGEDVSGLKRADRRTLKTLTLPKPYQNLFDYYKQELSMYGAEFGLRVKLAEMVVAKCGSQRAGGEEAATSSSNPDPDIFQGRLVSADWVKQQLKNTNFTRLTLGKGTILSPLAKDMLKEKGISVLYADER
jgi:hypothetical protein